MPWRGRHRHPDEGARLARAQRARGVEQVAIHRREGLLRLAQIEGAATKVSATITPAVCRTSCIPASSRALPNRPSGPKEASRAIPATAGEQDQRSSINVTTSERPRNSRGEQIGGGRPDEHDDRQRRQGRLQAEPESVACVLFAEAADQITRRGVDEDGDDRQRQEGEHQEQGEEERHPNAALRTPGGGLKPASSSAAAPSP